MRDKEFERRQNADWAGTALRSVGQAKVLKDGVLPAQPTKSLVALFPRPQDPQNGSTTAPTEPYWAQGSAATGAISQADEA